MKKILILSALVCAFSTQAAVTNSTVGCNTAEDFDTMVNAQVNGDQRMLDHLADNYICYQFHDGLEYSEIGTSALFSLDAQKIRVWLPGGGYVESYISKFEVLKDAK